MLKLGCRIFLLLPGLVFAGGFYEGGAGGDNVPHFVCYDGRVLTGTASGFVWKAKRGCFISRVPCDAHQANRYSYFNEYLQLLEGYRQCRIDYPFMLGEMQTH